MGDRARLVVISPPAPDPSALDAFCAAAAHAVDVLVLRCEDWSARRLQETASRLARRSPRPALFVSDRPDLAVATGCEGVQLKESSLRPAEVAVAFPGLRIGVSRHDAAGLVASEGVEFAFLSPIWATASKPGRRGLGIAALRAAAAASPVPVVALGGIDPGRAREALRAGAKGVAVRSWVWDHDPVAAVSALRDALSASEASR